MMRSKVYAAEAREKLRRLPEADVHILAKYAQMPQVKGLLLEIGERAISGLVMLMEDASTPEEECIVAMRVLGEMTAYQAIGPLQRMLRNPNPKVRMEAAATLNALGAYD
jgi:HEAT repeat protein